ncbi:hypothetical protein ACIBI3_20875 [Actinomadura luteofluorescens]|uniref:hypothetical protein n=1 Tax=Actinomadura luteofluorescens TaxID=46163 RepID=UPI00349A5F54
MRCVLLSGWQSDLDPSPGLGTARSLLAEWPALRIEAVDYSAACSGLHVAIPAAVHLLPGWDDIDAAADTLVEVIERSGGYFLSGLDLEAQLLAERAPAHPAMLLPPRDAFRAVRKPATEAAELLGMPAPRHRPATSTEEAARFAARHGWPVWVKGVRHQARAVGDLTSLRCAFQQIRDTWGPDDVLVQEHLDGSEESFAFAALHGRLLGACHMVKTAVTAQGKTWAGRVGPVPAPIMKAMRAFVDATAWTGGGEIETIRHRRTGELHLLEVNPRFPAWIHGASLTGFNLPAELVGAVAGRPVSARRPAANAFVRVTSEVPMLVPSETEGTSPSTESRLPLGKVHPSGMPVLSRKLALVRMRAQDAEPPVQSRPVTADVEPKLQRRLDEAVSTMGRSTPARLALQDELRERCRDLGRLAAEAGRVARLGVQIAYSVKTNPADVMLAAIRDAGFLAEATSRDEVRRCLRAGLTPERIVLTGPGKWWPLEAGDDVYTVNTILSDSLSDLERAVSRLAGGTASAEAVGVRLAPLRSRSRFGVPADDPEVFRELTRFMLSCAWSGPWALHFHLAPAHVGEDAWLLEVDGILALANRLPESVRGRISVVDLGGGWPSAALRDGRLQACLRTAALRVAGTLPSVRRLVVEPGRLIAEPSMALLTTVLDVRRHGRRRAAVVDGSIAELPDGTHVHPSLWRPRRGGRSGAWRRLGPGPDALYGRLCMEQDVLEHEVALPPELAAGDFVVFLDAGAYDASMSYTFGR